MDHQIVEAQGRIEPDADVEMAFQKVVMIPAMETFIASPTTQGCIILKYDGIINCEGFRNGFFSRPLMFQPSAGVARGEGTLPWNSIN